MVSFQKKKSYVVDLDSLTVTFTWTHHVFSSDCHSTSLLRVTINTLSCVMMPKNHQWATQSLHVQNNTCTTKRDDLTESIGVMSAKYPSKVKLELLTTLECQSWSELCILVFWGSLGFYSSVEPNFYTCGTSLFLIGKISINVHIFQNPPRVRILFILGLYGLGLIVRRKSFPFRVSWRPHNDQLSAVWPFDSSTLGPFTSDPFTISLFVSHCQVHLKGSVTSNFLPL